MNDSTVSRLTGASGVLAWVAGAPIAPLYFLFANPPAQWNVLTRNLLNLVICAFLMVFLAGLRQLIRQADAAYEWIATLSYGLGLTYLTVTLVAISLEVGVAFGAPGGTVDPTVHGPLAEGAILLHGSITRMLTAVFLVSAGYAILRTRVLPVWIGRGAYGIAAVNLAFVPSLYFGKDPARFYSALGWGNTALTASLILYWILAVSVTVLRRPPTAQLVGNY